MLEPDTRLDGQAAGSLPTLSHRGCTGAVEWDAADGEYFVTGRFPHGGLITAFGATIEDVERSFRSSVDAYLEPPSRRGGT